MTDTNAAVRDRLIQGSGGKLFFHIDDCGRMLGISRSSIYRMCKDGTGPRWQEIMGRRMFFVDDVADWIEKQREDAAEK